MSAIMTSRQAAEFDHALERCGLTAEHVKMMCSGNILKSFKDVLEGRSEIKPKEYEVDLDADPFIPKGWTLAKNDDGTPCHKKGGKWKYDPKKIGLYFSKKQCNIIDGYELRNELKNQTVMNANLLDFYLKNTHLIPLKYKTENIYFWGTIYQLSDGHLCVRGLYWDGACYNCTFSWLKSDWFIDNFPAVILIK